MTSTSVRLLRTKASSMALTHRLVASVKKSEEGSPASRLWAEAYGAVIDPLKSLFEEVEADFPAKVRADRHWAILIDRLEKEARIATDRQWLANGELPDVESRLHRYATRNDWDVRDCLDVWISQGSALRDAVEALKIDLSTPYLPPRDVIGVCALCWRTGRPAKRGDGFFCKEHGDVGSAAYRSARDRLYWRDPSQPLKPRISFVWHHVREIRAQIPRPLLVEPMDLVPMSRVCGGRAVPETGFRHVTLDIGRFAPVLKRVNRHFALDKVKPNSKSQLEFLAKVDPKLPSLAALQRRMHEVMVQDNCILLDRLMYAEACLEADLRRRSNRGPESAPSPEESQRIVVPYVFSYYGMENVITL